MQQRLNAPLSEPRNVAIFRALKLGDLLCAVPVFRSIKKKYPRCQLTLIALPWAKEFAELFSHYIDHFIEFPGLPGLPEQSFRASSYPEFLKQLQAQNLDLLIQLHGNGKLINPIMYLFGAKSIVGFHPDWEKAPENGDWKPYPENESEIWRLLKLLEHAGIPADGEDLEYPLSQGAVLDAKKLIGSVLYNSRGYICLHPGAISAPYFNAMQFSEVALALQRHGFQIVLTGSSSEAELCSLISNRLSSKIVNLAGKTSLATLGAVIKNAKLLISHDTAVSHIASALMRPSVVISAKSDKEAWAPSNRLLHRFLSRYHGITTHEVIRESLNLLSDSFCDESKKISGELYAQA